MWNPYDFTGKRILVAGATSGIGRATAIRLSEQGAQVCLLGRDTAKLSEVLRELADNHHRCFTVDFSDACDFKHIYDDVVSDGHKIDGIVYTAGIAKILPITLLKRTSMDESMSVNLYSFIEMVGMLSKKKYHTKASVVGVSSISVEYPQKCQSAYVATKSAMNTMVSAMALELADKGIRINTVMPSSTNTKMLQEAFDGMSEKSREHSLSRQILGLEQPEDVADIILFLLSDASRMITGRAIYADAGYLNFWL